MHRSSPSTCSTDRPTLRHGPSALSPFARLHALLACRRQDLVPPTSARCTALAQPYLRGLTRRPWLGFPRLGREPACLPEDPDASVGWTCRMPRSEFRGV